MVYLQELQFHAEVVPENRHGDLAVAKSLQRLFLNAYSSVFKLSKIEPQLSLG